ncbi:predicted protein [Histoplasma mississippiense (nom. inval.)]|nr:predicted protein [Histoplasma mississippiense (nom. inval.)]EDN10951.1 predicted protein [Histoplasma mississippiense (nom. inval.)]
MSSSYGLGQVWIEWFWSVGNLKLTSAAPVKRIGPQLS